MDLIEALKRDHVHAENVAKALEWLRQELHARNIPFALVGGLALRHYGYTRFTEDIDILTTRDGLDRIHLELVGQGLVVRFEGARKSLRETGHNVKVDLIASGEHAGSASSPVSFPDPASAAFTNVEGLRVPTLQTLVELKLAAGIWGSRPRDFGDVVELIKANRLAEDFAALLAPELRPKFLELLDAARRERPIE